MPYDINEMKGKIYTVAEVGEMLGIGVDAVRRRVREGLLPARNPPGRVGMVFLGDDLVKVLLGEAVATPAKKATPKRLKAALEVRADDGPGLPFDAPTARPEPVQSQAETIPARLPDGAVDRLKAWIAAKDVQVVALAQRAGIERTSLAHILGGDRGLSRTNAYRLRDAYGQALLDFLLGSGPMPEQEV